MRLVRGNGAEVRPSARFDTPRRCDNVGPDGMRRASRIAIIPLRRASHLRLRTFEVPSSNLHVLL
ncbi:hypothetical protein VL15_24545 [Burkholderia cepacia]|uniref:Uncharacterized protein n=1 Tax=Burkholderia cepacia TaxID=292 RepID=A0A0J5WFE2_BURCE|nr:hypothetical protein VL15_24545 [Burkholderia cepacia]